MLRVVVTQVVRVVVSEGGGENGGARVVRVVVVRVGVMNSLCCDICICVRCRRYNAHNNAT